MKETIEINGCMAEITWLEDHGDRHCAWATITGGQYPPEDGDVFQLGGSTYYIGEWQREGNELVARVYLR